MGELSITYIVIPLTGTIKNIFKMGLPPANSKTQKRNRKKHERRRKRRQADGATEQAPGVARCPEHEQGKGASSTGHVAQETTEQEEGAPNTGYVARETSKVMQYYAEHEGDLPGFDPLKGPHCALFGGRVMESFHTMEELVSYCESSRLLMTMMYRDPSAVASDAAATDDADDEPRASARPIDMENVPILKNWSVVVDLSSSSGITQYSAPEMVKDRYCVCGEMYNHPGFPNGEVVTTSTICTLAKTHVTTMSGSVYRLGDECMRAT